VESFFRSLIYNNPDFGFVVMSDDVPATSVIQLKTNSLNWVMPGIWEVYGPHKKVDV
jgi:hypothetical protein